MCENPCTTKTPFTVSTITARETFTPIMLAGYYAVKYGLLPVIPTAEFDNVRRQESAQKVQGKRLELSIGFSYPVLERLLTVRTLA